MLLTYLFSLLLAPLSLANPISRNLLQPRDVSETFEVWGGPHNGQLTTATASCTDDLLPITTISDVHTLDWFSGCDGCYPPYSETWTIATAALPLWKAEELDAVTLLTPHDTFSIPPNPLGTLSAPPPPTLTPVEEEEEVSTLFDGVAPKTRRDVATAAAVAATATWGVAVPIDNLPTEARVE